MLWRLDRQALGSGQGPRQSLPWNWEHATRGMLEADLLCGKCNLLPFCAEFLQELVGHRPQFCPNRFWPELLLSVDDHR